MPVEMRASSPPSSDLLVQVLAYVDRDTVERAQLVSRQWNRAVLACGGRDLPLRLFDMAELHWDSGFYRGPRDDRRTQEHGAACPCAVHLRIVCDINHWKSRVDEHFVCAATWDARAEAMVRALHTVCFRLLDVDVGSTRHPAAQCIDALARLLTTASIVRAREATVIANCADPALWTLLDAHLITTGTLHVRVPRAPLTLSDVYAHLAGATRLGAPCERIIVSHDAKLERTDVASFAGMLGMLQGWRCVHAPKYTIRFEERIADLKDFGTLWAQHYRAPDADLDTMVGRFSFFKSPWNWRGKSGRLLSEFLRSLHVAVKRARWDDRRRRMYEVRRTPRAVARVNVTTINRTAACLLCFEVLPLRRPGGKPLEPDWRYGW